MPPTTYVYATDSRPFGRGGVENTRLEAKARAKDTKKAEAKVKDTLTDPIEAKERNARGQG